MLQRSAGNRAVTAMLSSPPAPTQSEISAQRDIADTLTNPYGTFAINMHPISEMLPPDDSGPPRRIEREAGTIEFMPDDGAPPSAAIHFTQVARTTVVRASGRERDYRWTGGESPRNDMRTSGGFFVDQRAGYLSHQEHAADDYSYDESGPPSGNNRVGHAHGFDTVAAYIYDQPGGPDPMRYRFETVARGSDTGISYGGVRWGFSTRRDSSGAVSVVVPEPRPTLIQGSSPTVDAAVDRFRAYWRAHPPGRSSAAPARAPASISAAGSVQRLIEIGGSVPGHGLPLNRADFGRFLAANGLSNPHDRSQRAREILLEMVSSHATLRFATEGDLAQDLVKRMRIVELMHMSQGDSAPLGERGFGYPFRTPALAYGPRVNYAARNYWTPTPGSGYGHRTIPASLRTATPTVLAAYFHDQDPTSLYEFHLTPDGLAHPYQALTHLFDPQPPNRRTLIHCDYLISVIQYRVFAESIGIPEFERRVRAGTIPMVLTANGFQAITRVPGAAHNPNPANTSLTEFELGSEADLVIGDHVRFHNHPAYDLIIGGTGGVWRMENAILVGVHNGEQIFEGHGSGRLTGRQMRQRLVLAYNTRVDTLLEMLRQIRSLRPRAPERVALEGQMAHSMVQPDHWGMPVVTGRNVSLELDIVNQSLLHITDVPGLRWPATWYAHPPGTMTPVYRPVESSYGSTP